MARVTRDKLIEIERENRYCAQKYLADPVTYAGIQLEWAKQWTGRSHQLPIGPDVEKKPKTLEERMNDYEKRKRKKQITSRQERWKNKKWRFTHRYHGGVYLNVNHFYILLFQRVDKRWVIRISDELIHASQVGRKTYAALDEAKEAAFIALLYMEGKRSAPVFVNRSNQEQPRLLVTGL